MWICFLASSVFLTSDSFAARIVLFFFFFIKQGMNEGMA